jgi:glycerol kinase
MSGPLLLGIDEGTTAVKAALFDTDLRPVAEARRPVPVTHPQPGWVEQDPEEILEAVIDTVAEVLQQADGCEVIAAGLDHQGESVLAWEAHSGKPLSRVIVWQDKRQEALLADIDAQVPVRSGLPLDPYFSAGKLAWLLANEAPVRAARERGTLRMGTLDAFLCDRLAGRYASDLSTASRMQLLAVGGRDWDPALLRAFGLRQEWLPSLGPSFGELGVLRHERWGTDLPLRAQLVDQQAALAGSGAVRAGELKATYGTGVFVLGLAGEGAVPAGLLPTVAWGAPRPGGGLGEVAQALDGGVFAAGTLLQWLAGGLGLGADAPAIAAAAGTVGDSAGVLVLPALAGLGAPWWQPGARGVIAGLHPGVGRAHIARAALEAIAWRVADIVEAMAEAAPVRSVRIDGGLAAAPELAQIQADALGIELSAGALDSTVLGTAMLAGVGAGVFADPADAAARLPRPRLIAPRMAELERAERRERWRSFVRLAAQL